jgi:hypothetical protein
MAKRGPRSVLRGQKPKRGKQSKADRAKRLKRWGLTAVIALSFTGGALAWRSLSRRSAAAAAASAPRPTDWKVSLKVDGNEPLADRAAEEILTLARQGLGRGRPQDLQKVAAAIQRLDAYSQVHVLKLGPDSAAVQVHLRQAAFCVEADKLRLVSVDGDVYGSVERPESGASGCPGPILTGLFDAKQQAKLTLESDFTLSLNAEQKAALTEALELWGEAQRRDLQLASLSYRKYRGFFAALSGQDLEIAMGRAPFADKLDRLKGILSKLAQKGEQAARIELDYQGKAFIKLRKL